MPSEWSFSRFYPVLILFWFLSTSQYIYLRSILLFFRFCSFWHFQNNLRKITQKQKQHQTSKIQTLLKIQITSNNRFDIWYFQNSFFQNKNVKQKTYLIQSANPTIPESIPGINPGTLQQIQKSKLYFTFHTIFKAFTPLTTILYIVYYIQKHAHEPQYIVCHIAQ